MAFRRDTEYRELPDNAELVELPLTDYDFALRYETDSHEEFGFGEEIEIHVDERNSLDEVEVFFREEQYDSVVQTVEEQLEADRKNREDLYAQDITPLYNWGRSR